MTFSRVMLFGDSLTQNCYSEGGWGSILADHFQRRADFFNRGFSGYNSRWGKLILPSIVPKFHPLPPPDAVAIFFGPNDSALPDVNPHQHVPVLEYKSNLLEMCNYLVQEVGVEKQSLVLITSPPLEEEMWREHSNGNPDRCNAVTQQYATAVREVCQEQSLCAVDLFFILCSKPELKQYFTDGLHLSPAGNRVLADALLPLLESRVKTTEPVFPYWRDINPVNPQESLLTPSR